MAAKQSVINEAMKLPEAERAEVAEALYESIQGPIDPDAQQAWSDEIARRVQEIDAGQAKFIPWAKARKLIAGENGDAGATG